jgi:hypothetical protein
MELWLGVSTWDVIRGEHKAGGTRRRKSVETFLLLLLFLSVYKHHHPSYPEAN